MAQRIYLIEDDTALRTELAHVLELSGYAVAAYEGTWGDTAARALAAEPDCIVLDLKLPGADGHSICRDIRGKSSVPILMLTSSESEFDEVMAMNLGADDYVTKPFSVEELLARLRATTRRLSAAGQTQAEDAVFENGELRIEYAAGCAWLGDKELHLTPIEYKLLCLLARNVGKVLTHTYILQQIWGSSGASDIASLRVFMATLRKKLEAAPDSPQYIQTHIGVGYRMLRVE